MTISGRFILVLAAAVPVILRLIAVDATLKLEACRQAAFPTDAQIFELNRKADDFRNREQQQ